MADAPTLVPQVLDLAAVLVFLRLRVHALGDDLGGAQVEVKVRLVGRLRRLGVGRGVLLVHVDAPPPFEQFPQAVHDALVRDPFFDVVNRAGHFVHRDEVGPDHVEFGV